MIREDADYLLALSFHAKLEQGAAMGPPDRVEMDFHDQGLKEQKENYGGGYLDNDKDMVRINLKKYEYRDPEALVKIKYPRRGMWLGCVWIAASLLMIYTCLFNSYSSLIDHLLTTAQFNQIRDPKADRYSGQSGDLNGTYFPAIDYSACLNSIQTYVQYARILDFQYCGWYLVAVLFAYSPYRLQQDSAIRRDRRGRLLALLVWPLLTLLSLDCFYALGLLQQALYTSMKYKMTVPILGVHPLLACLLLLCTALLLTKTTLMVMQECGIKNWGMFSTLDETKSRRGSSNTLKPANIRIRQKSKEAASLTNVIEDLNRMQAVEDLNRMLAFTSVNTSVIKEERSDNEKRIEDLKAIISGFNNGPSRVQTVRPEARFASCFAKFTISYFALGFGALYTWQLVRSIWFLESMQDMKLEMEGNSTVLTNGKIELNVTDLLNSKLGHLALPVNLGFNIPLAFYDLTNIFDIDVVLSEVSDLVLVPVKCLVWMMASTLLLFSTCCAHKLLAGPFRFLFASSTLHSFTVMRQTFSVLLLVYGDLSENQELQELFVMSVVSFGTILVNWLVLESWCSGSIKIGLRNKGLGVCIYMTSDESFGLSSFRWAEKRTLRSASEATVKKCAEDIRKFFAEFENESAEVIRKACAEMENVSAEVIRKECAEMENEMAQIIRKACANMENKMAEAIRKECAEMENKITYNVAPKAEERLDDQYLKRLDIV